MWTSFERLYLGTNIQKHPLQYRWFLLHLELWRRRFSPMALVLLQWRTGRVQCWLAVFIFQSHRLFPAMRQCKFPQYLRINLPPPRCVRLLEWECIEDPSQVRMSGLSADNTLTVSVLVMRCQHKQMCLIYRVVPLRPLQSRWFPLDFAFKGCLARQCNDGASRLYSQGCDQISLPSIRLHWTQG